MDTNLAALCQVASDVLGRYDLELTPETRILSVKGWDSVALVKMLLLLESQMGFVFDTYDIPNIRTVGDVVKMMEKAQA
ncbi:MAG: acyl carrier protein [Thermoguttaceae bacterium]|nr:acyl carrier protein [Thermoguttaceae bacterium]MBQ9812389.1 acyl carrier protein [Thermoguttaceae bacterium]